MAHKADKDTENVVAKRLTTITQLLLDFFEPGNPDTSPCPESINNYLRRIAEALEVYAGGVGVSHRLTAMESQIRIMNMYLASIAETLDISTENIQDRENPA